MSRLKFFAKPQEAVAHVFPATAPNMSEKHAITTKSAPYFAMVVMSAPAFIALTRSAVIKGIRHSITTSNTISKGVSRVSFLYSRMLSASFLNTLTPSFIIYITQKSTKKIIQLIKNKVKRIYK